MDRTKLGRRLRQLARFGRHVRDQRLSLERKMKLVDLTEGELQLLVDNADGYKLVLDARERGKHVTLSDADEVSKKRALAREAKRDAETKKKREARRAEVEKERQERKAHVIEQKKKKMLDLVRAMAGQGEE